MSIELAACPDCGSRCATPVNSECGCDRIRGDGKTDGVNLWCPACGWSWRGSEVEVADAWRDWVLYELKQPEVTYGDDALATKIGKWSERAQALGRITRQDAIALELCASELA